MLQSSRFASTTSVCARRRIGRRRPVPRYRTTRFAFVGTRAADEDVGRGEAGRFEPLGDGLGDRRRRARRVAGLDLDHLLVDRARELALALGRHGAILRAECGRAEQGAGRDANHEILVRSIMG